MTDLVIAGIRGRMGQALVRLVRDRTDMRIVAGGGRHGADREEAERLGCPVVLPLAEIGDAVQRADVLIDFSSAGGTAALLRHAGPALAGRALVVGTTGLGDDTERALQELAHSTAVLAAANFSIGVNLLLQVARQVAAALPSHRYDVEIVEAHHRGKADAPSGTALALGRAVAAGRDRDLDAIRHDGRSGNATARQPDDIGFHAVRGGGVAGEHRVLFLGALETVELRHEALDRGLFADGALHAAAWIAGRAPGRYSMDDVLQL